MNKLATHTETAEIGSNPVMISLLVIARRLEDKIETSLAALGLSFAKLNVLSRMAEAGAPLSLGEIADRLSCVRSNVTQLIDRLEADGLVRREADAGDRRSILAVLTSEGRDRQAAGAAEFARVNAEFTASLPPDKRESLEDALTFIR